MRSLVVVVALLAVGPARAEAVRRFAIVVGHDGVVAGGEAPLRYADDDALRYADALGAFVAPEDLWLLVDPDSETARELPEYATELPTSEALDRAVEALLARAGGAPFEAYFVFTGHGRLVDGRGQLELADGPLPDRALERRIIGPLAARARRVHVVIDACFARHMLTDRGPGGRRHAIYRERFAGFLSRHPNVGVMLASGDQDATFEAEALRGGVFSHAVLSALLAAGDADGAAGTSYVEMQAFLAAALDATRVRLETPEQPRPFVRPPGGDDGALFAPDPGVRLVLPPEWAGPFRLLDERALVLGEFGKAAGRPLRLNLPVRPRRAGDDVRRYLLEAAVAGGPTARIDVPCAAAAARCPDPAQARVLDASAAPPAEVTASRGEAGAPAVTAADVTAVQADPPWRDPIALAPEPVFGARVAGLANLDPTGGPAGAPFGAGAHAGLWAQRGDGRSEAALEYEYRRQPVRGDGFGFAAHTAGLWLQHAAVWTAAAHELALGAYATGGLLVQVTEPRGDVRRALVAGAGVVGEATLAVDRDDAWSLVLRLNTGPRLVATRSTRRYDAALGAALGFDWSP
jgi:hypothetical protein